MPFFNQSLKRPLQITAYTVEGQPLGYFTCQEITPDGIYLKGDLTQLLEALRLLTNPIFQIDIQESRKRPIRAVIRANLSGYGGGGPKAQSFFKFVRMSADHKRRYLALLYGE